LDDQEEETWERALLRFRKEKDDFFRTGEESPIDQVGRNSFTSLKYFDPAPAFRFEVNLERYAGLDTVVMATSTGTRQLYTKVGRFEVNLDGQMVTLQAYQSAERVDRNIFFSYRDATSEKESYGAARYLDLEVEHDDVYALDFNYAYNPYCAYSENYVCPLPPHENWLRVPIMAGEKKYRD